MENRILSDDKNLMSKKYEISTGNSSELKSSELFIQQKDDCSNGSDLESEIEKCKEILKLEGKVPNCSNLDDISIKVIETNEFGYQAGKSSYNTEGIQTHSNSNSDKNKASLMSKQSDKFTKILPENFKHHEFKSQDISEIGSQYTVKLFPKNTQHSPEQKRIKLSVDESHYTKKFETNHTYDVISCAGNIAESKCILINRNSFDLLQNKSLNTKMQSSYTFNSLRNDISVRDNLNHDNESEDFPLHENKKNFIEHEDVLKNNDYKIKSKFKLIEKTYSTISKGENELDRESCDTNFILHENENGIENEDPIKNRDLKSTHLTISEGENESSCDTNFTMGNNKNLIENEGLIKNGDSKVKSIFQHLTDLTTNKRENESRRESCETNYSGDTLILNCEESDIDSEIEKCNELLNQNSYENMCSKINSNINCQNYNQSDSNDSMEKVMGFKGNNFKFQETNSNNSKEAFLTQVNMQCETNNSIGSTHLLKDESDFESEIEKCNELLNPLEVMDEIIIIDEDSQTPDDFNDIENNEKEIIVIDEDSQTPDYIINMKNNEKEIIVIDEDSQTCYSLIDIENNGKEIVIDEDTQTRDNLIDLKNNEKDMMDIKIIPETVKYGVNLEFQNNVITSNGKSPSKETQITEKILFTNLTPLKRRPERIFKLAIESINEISTGNTNPDFKSNDSSDQNNFLSSIKLNDKEILKDRIGVKDYFEDEKDDITNPEWQAVKNLSTNEERYNQVRKCWKSCTVPDPNKNLTYHSYRKRLFGNDIIKPRSIRQHKRHASSSLPGKDAKRPCTFFLDREIDSIKKTNETQKQEMINEMQNRIAQQCSLRYRGFDLYNQSHPVFDRISNTVTNQEYNRIVNTCENSFRNKIWALSERRNEVLKFYSFYKGLNDIHEDPTLLTESQFKELDEIENIYRQFNNYYGDVDK